MERERHNTEFRPAKRAWLYARAVRPGEGCTARCCYCGDKMKLRSNAPATPDVAKAATLDHVNPKRKRGRNSPDNMVAACRRCNADKGNRTPQQWAADGGPADAPARAAKQIASLPTPKALACIRGIYDLPPAGGQWDKPVITPAQRRGHA